MQLRYDFRELQGIVIRPNQTSHDQVRDRTVGDFYLSFPMTIQVVCDGANGFAVERQGVMPPRQPSLHFGG